MRSALWLRSGSSNASRHSEGRMNLEDYSKLELVDDSFMRYISPELQVVRGLQRRSSGVYGPGDQTICQGSRRGHAPLPVEADRSSQVTAIRGRGRRGRRLKSLRVFVHAEQAGQPRRGFLHLVQPLAGVDGPAV